MKKGKILVLGVLGVLLLMLVGCSDTLTGNNPGTGATLYGVTNPYDTTVVRKVSDGTVVGSGVADSNGKYAISGIPSGELYVDTGGGDSIVYYNSGSGSIYTSPDPDVASASAQLPGADLLELQKLELLLTAAGITGTAAVNIIKDFWAATGLDLNTVITDYMASTGYTLTVAKQKGKIAFQDFLNGENKKLYDAAAQNGVASLNVNLKMTGLYGTFIPIFDDMSQSGNSTTSLLGYLGFGLMKADWFTGQNLADYLISIGAFSVKTQSVKTTSLTSAITEGQNFMWYSLVYAAVNGCVATISDATTKGILTASLSLLNNYMIQCLINGSLADMTSVATQTEAVKEIVKVADTTDMTTRSTDLKVALAERPATVTTLGTNLSRIGSTITTSISSLDLAKFMTYFDTTDIPRVAETP